MKKNKGKEDNLREVKKGSPLRRRDFLLRAAAVGSALFVADLIPLASSQTRQEAKRWQPTKDFCMLIGAAVMVPEFGDLFIKDPLAAAKRAKLKLSEREKKWLKDIPDMKKVGDKLVEHRYALFGGRVHSMTVVSIGN